MSGRISTHILDTSRGLPAAGMRLELSRLVDGVAESLARTESNRDGRTDRPLLEGNALRAGDYRLEFHVAEYFRGLGHPDAGRFLDIVPIQFRVMEATGSYHIPLLVSPWSYSTYRGS